MHAFLAILRRGAGLVLALELVSLVALMALTQVAPRLGYSVYVVRGASMAPAIPLGALAVDQPGTPAHIVIGDVVSIRAANGVLYTHRVIEVTSSIDGLLFRTQGDANPAADPSPVPETAITGRVLFHLPVAGYVVAFLGMPAGLMSILAAIAATLLMVWLLEDLESATRRRHGDQPAAAGLAATPAD
jgi:signal peptidase I